MLTPLNLNKRIERLVRSYERGLENLAMEVFHDRIIPYCEYNKLSFTMMDGIPRFVDSNNEYINPPKFITNLFNIEDEYGNKLLRKITESYKYDDSVDFNIAFFKQYEKDMLTNKTLAKIRYSPFL